MKTRIIFVVCCLALTLACSSIFANEKETIYRQGIHAGMICVYLVDQEIEPNAGQDQIQAKLKECVEEAVKEYFSR